MPGRAVALTALGALGCGVSPTAPAAHGEELRLSGATVRIFRDGAKAVTLEATSLRVGDGEAVAEEVAGEYLRGRFRADRVRLELRSSAAVASGDVRATWGRWAFAGEAFRFGADGTVSSDRPFHFIDEASGATHAGTRLWWDPPAGRATLGALTSRVLLDEGLVTLEAATVEYDEDLRRATLRDARVDGQPRSAVTAWFAPGRVGSRLERLEGR